MDRRAFLKWGTSAAAASAAIALPATNAHPDSLPGEVNQADASA